MMFVLAGVGGAKAANLYQASRAFTYLTFASQPVVAERSSVVIPAVCEEGAGHGPGEREFLNGLRGGKTPQEVLEHLRATGFGAGGQRAFLVARALLKSRLMVVGGPGAPRSGGNPRGTSRRSGGSGGPVAQDLRRELPGSGHPPWTYHPPSPKQRGFLIAYVSSVCFGFRPR